MAHNLEPQADEDDLLAQATELVRSHNQASPALLQRRLRIGYRRAVKILDQLEARDVVVSPSTESPGERLAPGAVTRSGEDFSRKRQPLKVHRRPRLTEEESKAAERKWTIRGAIIGTVIMLAIILAGWLSRL